MTQRRFPEDMNRQQHRCEELKHGVFPYWKVFQV